MLALRFGPCMVFSENRSLLGANDIGDIKTGPKALLCFRRKVHWRFPPPLPRKKLLPWARSRTCSAQVVPNLWLGSHMWLLFQSAAVFLFIAEFSEALIKMLKVNGLMAAVESSSPPHPLHVACRWHATMGLPGNSFGVSSRSWMATDRGGLSWRPTT